MAGQGRITWQNVAAPDFSAALDAYATQGELFRQGAQDISGMFSGMNDRRKTAASNEALNAGMKINTVDGWDTAMQGGLLESLGISADQATPELMDWLSNQRGELSGNRADDLSHQRNGTNWETDKVGLERERAALTMDGLDAQRTQQLFDQAAYQNERQQTVLDPHEDLLRERSEGEVAETEALEAVKVQAVELADDLANTTSTKDEALRMIRDDKTIPASTKDIILENITARDEGYWSVAPEYQGASKLTKPFQVFDEYLGGQKNALINKHGGNMAVRTLLDGYERFDGANDPAEALVTKFGADETFSESAGDVRDLHKALVAETGLPPEIVGLIMEQNVKQSRFMGIPGTAAGPLGGDEQSFDRPAIREALKQFADPATMNLLNSEASGIRRDWDQLDADVKDRERMAVRYEQELSRGGDGSRAIAEFNELRNGIVDRDSKPVQDEARALSEDIPYQPSNESLSIPGRMNSPVPAGSADLSYGDQILQQAGGVTPTQAAPMPTQAPAAPRPTPDQAPVDPLMGGGMGWDNYIARMNGDTNPRVRNEPNDLARQSDRINQGISDYDRQVEGLLRDNPTAAQTKFGPGAEAIKLVESSSLPGGVKVEATQALTALETGTGPDGRALTPPEMQQYAQKVANVLEAIEANGGSDSAIEAIMNKVKEWLPF